MNDVKSVVRETTGQRPGRDPLSEERRRRVAALRAVHEAAGLAGLVAYCEQLLAGERIPSR